MCLVYSRRNDKITKQNYNMTVLLYGRLFDCVMKQLYDGNWATM